MGFTRPLLTIHPKTKLWDSADEHERLGAGHRDDPGGRR
jgi:hypothetical protein